MADDTDRIVSTKVKKKLSNIKSKIWNINYQVLLRENTTGSKD